MEATENTVLIVNCAPERAEHLRKILAKREDLNVIAHVFDGRIGLGLALSIRPALVFTCIALCGLTGLELTRVIKRESEQTRVLVGTIQADKETDAYNAGADAFLAFPSTPEVVLQAVDAALAGARK